MEDGCVKQCVHLSDGVFVERGGIFASHGCEKSGPGNCKDCRRSQ